MKIKDVLTLTADRYTSGEYLWKRGVLDGPAGERCIAAGIATTVGLMGRLAKGYDADMHNLAAPVAEHLRTLHDACQNCSPLATIVSWNDQVGRSMADVIAALRAGAARPSADVDWAPTPHPDWPALDRQPAPSAA